MKNTENSLRLVRVSDGRLLDMLPDDDGSYFAAVTAPLASWYTENLYEEDCTDVFEELGSCVGGVGEVAVYRGDELLFTDDGDALLEALYDYGVADVIERWHDEDEDDDEREENVGDWWYGEV